MNERIRELAEQAENYAAEQNDKFGVSYKKTYNEKFAELIVRECASVVENLSPGYNDYRNQIEDAFRRDCVAELKQHFGVQ